MPERRQCVAKRRRRFVAIERRRQAGIGRGRNAIVGDHPPCHPGVKINFSHAAEPFRLYISMRLSDIARPPRKSAKN